MTMTPKISVCMCFYNTDPVYLREAVDSVLAQTFNDFELIILDDGSTDPRAAATLATYHDPRIIRTTNPQNLGIPASRNRMLEMAQGEFIAVMDADDVALPERFARQIAFMTEHPEVGVCGGAAEFFPPARVKHFPINDMEIRREMFIRCPFLQSTVMIRASVLRAHNLCYPPRAVAEDYALWAQLFPHTRFHNLPEVLVRYRQSGQNITGRNTPQDLQEVYGVQQALRLEQPAAYEVFFTIAPQIRRIKLFGWLTLFKIKSQLSHTKIYLFGFIPLITLEK